MTQPLEPRRWIEFALEAYPTGVTTTYRWSTRPLAGTFFVEGRIPVDGWDTIDRKASSMSGEYHIDSASVIIDDADGLVRSLLADTTTQWFLNREGAFKVLSESAFAAGLTPRLLFGGRCFDVQLQDRRQARLSFEDILSPYLDRTYPQYTIGDAYPYRFDDPYEIDATLNTDDPGLQVPYALREQVLPIYYGPFIDSAVDPITGLPRGKGMCPTFFMGYTFLTGGTGDVPNEPSPELAVIMTGHEAEWGGWGELVVCLGETDIPNVYASSLLNPPTRILFAADRYGVDILAPGHPGWPFATDYVMRNGCRCTVIYARGPVLWHHITGLVNITVDVCGQKNLAGDAVDQAGFVYQEFLSQHVLAYNGQGYTAGPCVGLPTFADDGRAMIWTSKVQAWQTMTGLRTGTAKGYLCSMALTEPTTLRQILATWHLTFDAFSAKNAAGQLYPFSLDDTASASSGIQIREWMELEALPAPRLAWDEIENTIDYTVGWDPEQKTARTTVLTVKDDDAIAALKGDVRKGGVRKPSLRELKYTADDVTAADVIGRRLMRLKAAPRYQALPVRMDGIDREIGEQVRVSHRDGIGAALVGYVDQPMTILEHALKGHHVALMAVDMSRILIASARWADPSIPDWSSATDAQRIEFGFWTADDGTLPPDGATGSEWR